MINSLAIKYSMLFQNNHDMLNLLMTSDNDLDTLLNTKRFNRLPNLIDDDTWSYKLYSREKGMITILNRNCRYTILLDDKIYNYLTIINLQLTFLSLEELLKTLRKLLTNLK